MTHKEFFEIAKCGLLICKNDSYSTIIEGNDTFFEMTGYTRDEMKDLYNNQFARLVIDDLSQILQKVGNAVRGVKVLDYEYQIRHKSGEAIWIHDVATYDEKHDIFYVVIMDIGYKAKELEKADRVAVTDKITGLLNRSGLERNIKNTIEQKDDQLAHAILLIDLDNFKAVNDTKGHLAGDAVIAETGRRLKQILGEENIIGRLGGDEFMVYIRSIESENATKQISQQIVEGLSMYVDELYISVSVGTLFDSSGKSEFNVLYQLVDEALYKAKSGNKGRYEFISI